MATRSGISGTSLIASLVLASFAFSFTPRVAFGQTAERKYLGKDTFYSMESVQNPAISPDGAQVVFSRGFVDASKDQNSSNLWLTDVAGTRLRQLTDGTWRDSSPVWSPDGSRLAFLSNRSGSTQVHVLWPDTRESAQLTRVDRDVAGLAWSPDGTRLAFTMTLPDEAPVLTVKLPPSPKGAQLAKGATVIDRPSWGADGVGPTSKEWRHVFVVDAVVGGTPRQITSGDYNHTAPEWSADGRRVFVSAIRKPEAEYLRGDSEIYAIDLASLAVTALTDRSGPDSAPAGLARRQVDRLHGLRPAEASPTT